MVPRPHQAVCVGNSQNGKSRVSHPLVVGSNIP
jgi:hypothetical protein